MWRASLKEKFGFRNNQWISARSFGAPSSPCALFWRRDNFSSKRISRRIAYIFPPTLRASNKSSQILSIIPPSLHPHGASFQFEWSGTENGPCCVLKTMAEALHRICCPGSSSYLRKATAVRSIDPKAVWVSASHSFRISSKCIRERSKRRAEDRA